MAGQLPTSFRGEAARAVCNIGWISRYEGLIGRPDKIVGGGKWVAQNGSGQEVTISCVSKPSRSWRLSRRGSGQTSAFVWVFIPSSFKRRELAYPSFLLG